MGINLVLDSSVRLSAVSAFQGFGLAGSHCTHLQRFSTSSSSSSTVDPLALRIWNVHVWSMILWTTLKMERTCLFKLLQEIGSSYRYCHVNVMNNKQWLFLCVVWEIGQVVSKVEQKSGCIFLSEVSHWVEWYISITWRMLKLHTS